MKLRRLTIKLVSGVTLCVAAGPLACSNDNSSHAAPDGGPDAAQEASTTHPDAKVTPPKPDAHAGKDTGAPGKPDATTVDGGPKAKPDAAPDGSTSVPKCTAPADPTKAKVCLTFDPEPVKFQATPLNLNNPDALDGQGILVVRIFDGPNPMTATAIGGTVYPPQPDGGLAQVSVDALPQFDFDNLPTTAYVFAVFADNLRWFQDTTGLTYGTFVSGLDLSEGLKAGLPVKPVTLTKGKGTSLKPFMTAMRLFTSDVELGLPDAGPFAGDGQGPLSVGVFAQPIPGGAKIYGTASGTCANARKLPAPVAGFFYGTGDFWFAGQIDDFFAASATNPVPGGALVSIGADQQIPDSQRVTVADDAYAVAVPPLVLTAVLPLGTGEHDKACDPPVPAVP